MQSSPWAQLLNRCWRQRQFSSTKHFYLYLSFSKNINKQSKLFMSSHYFKTLYFLQIPDPEQSPEPQRSLSNCYLNISNGRRQAPATQKVQCRSWQFSNEACYWLPESEGLHPSPGLRLENFPSWFACVQNPYPQVGGDKKLHTPLKIVIPFFLTKETHGFLPFTNPFSSAHLFYIVTRLGVLA